MIEAIFRPLAAPGYKSRKSATFRVSYSARLDLLENELRAIRAQDIVIQAGFAMEQIRNDGWPRSSARPTHPAVVLTFRTKRGIVSMPCDTYKNMEDNIYAIAKSLEALRSVDRYGVTQNGEQYRGWTALPEAGKSDSTRKAAVTLACYAPALTADQIQADRGAMQEAYRMAAKKAHPDVGGARQAWDEIQQAKDTLEAHFRAGEGSSR
jgi:hypothetical protein